MILRKSYQSLTFGTIAFMVPWLNESSEYPEFPPLSRALREPNGLLAAGGALTSAWLLAAYRQGIFPWYGEGEPLLWWSPSPRMVLFPEEFKLSRSLAKTIAKGVFEVRFDSAFREVMQACASTPREGQNGTWIMPEMIEAYCALHEQGYAHSVESWRDGVLVGGLYGLCLDRVFFGESMFSHQTDASKVAFAALLQQLSAKNVAMIDCQQATRHLTSLGGRTIPRQVFRTNLDRLIHSSFTPQSWRAMAQVPSKGPHV